jgi:phosphonate metabolism protein (transferase hexapeptide repeat family)
MQRSKRMAYCQPLSLGFNSFVTFLLRYRDRQQYIPVLTFVIAPIDNTTRPRTYSIWKMQMSGKMLSAEPTIDPTASVRDSRLGTYTEVGARTLLLDVAMDDYSYVVNDSQITYATIGKFCSIAAMTRINPGNHPMHRASQAHFSYRASTYFAGENDEAEFFEWRKSHRVHIGHDVWIGHGAIVLPGRRVGTGSVIAAGAIVTRDVSDYTIVGGNPARPIKRRFPEAIASRLMALAWWEWSHETLRRALPDFRKLAIEGFLEKYEAEPGSRHAHTGRRAVS